MHDRSQLGLGGEIRILRIRLPTLPLHASTSARPTLSQQTTATPLRGQSGVVGILVILDAGQKNAGQCRVVAKPLACLSFRRASNGRR